MTSVGDDDFDFVKSSSPLNDGSTYGSMTTPSYDTDYRIDDSAAYVDPKETERQMEKWREELEAIENDIQSLSTTLNTKIELANELKRNLGIGPHNPFKDLQLSLQSGIKNIRDSSTYQKTNETLGKTIDSVNTKIHDSVVYQKTTAAAKTVQEKTSSALSTISSSMSKKIGDIRNSSTFKSLEEKVETTYTNVKAKVRGSKSDNNLNSPAEESEEDGPTSAENLNTTDEQIPL